MKHSRDNQDLLTPGRKPVLELLRSRPEGVDTIFLADDAPGLGDIVGLCREGGVRFRKVRRPELDRMFSGNHQGVVARLRGRELVDLETLLERTRHRPFPLIIALDQVQDPGNVGTLARTLLALGGGGLLFPRDRTAFMGPAAAKAAAGADFPAVLILGNEDKGMRPNVGKRCSRMLSIPMHGGFDSLNVAQAGAMIMTEMLRRWGARAPLT